MFKSCKILGLAIAFLLPTIACAQTSGLGNAGANGSGMNGSRGGTSTQGSFGNPNTTVLGATVNLGFNSVFGTSPTIANTNTDPFAAYRPADTASSGSGSANRGTGSSFSGSGLSGFSNAGSGISNSAFGSTGSTVSGSRTQAGISGVSGGNQFGSGQFGNSTLGANRTGTLLGGANNLTGGGFNRNTLGGAMGGGANFLGGGNNFLGSGMGATGQQTQASPGYSVNVEGVSAPNIPLPLANAPQVEVQTRLQNAPGLVGAQNLHVTTDGTVAVLKGKVANENAKRLAAAMLLLEPGINQVDNQLEVVSVTPPQPSAPTPPQANPPKQ